MAERELTPEEIAANIAKATAEADKANAEARRTLAEASAAEIQLRSLQRLEKSELAKDSYHHVYNFDQSVSSSSVKACIARLTEWVRNAGDEKLSIEIVFNSPGGSVVDGMALWDYLQMLKKQGHHITTSAIGMAASMAGILLQAGNVRRMGAEAYLLIHQGSFGAGGSVAEVEDTVQWVKMMQKRILAIFASRSKLTTSQIAKKWDRRDWWMDSDEALKHGFIDEIG